MSKRFPALFLTVLALALAPPAFADHHEGKGPAKASEKAAQGDEMRERRDERKTIMEQEKSAAEPGTPRKGKKSWWRFWESDESE